MRGGFLSALLGAGDTMPPDCGGHATSYGPVEEHERTCFACVLMQQEGAGKHVIWFEGVVPQGHPFWDRMKRGRMIADGEFMAVVEDADGLRAVAPFPRWQEAEYRLRDFTAVALSTWVVCEAGAWQVSS